MTKDIYVLWNKLQRKLARLDLLYTQARDQGRKLQCVKIVKQYVKLERHARQIQGEIQHAQKKEVFSK